MLCGWLCSSLSLSVWLCLCVNRYDLHKNFYLTMALHCTHTHPHKNAHRHVYAVVYLYLYLLRMFFWHCEASSLVSSLSLDRYLTNIYQKIYSKTIILILQFICTICIHIYSLYVYSFIFAYTCTCV